MHLFSILGTYFGTSANNANGAEAATVQEERKKKHKWILFRGQEKLGRKKRWFKGEKQTLDSGLIATSFNTVYSDGEEKKTTAKA